MIGAPPAVTFTPWGLRELLRLRSPGCTGGSVVHATKLNVKTRLLQNKLRLVMAAIYPPRSTPAVNSFKFKS